MDMKVGFKQKILPLLYYFLAEEITFILPFSTTCHLQGADHPTTDINSWFDGGRVFAQNMERRIP
jgi:hypothetical protein